MIALIQRVKSAKVEINGQCVGQIKRGLLVLLGVQRHDDEQSAAKLLDKVLAYRVFADEVGKMNRNVIEAGGSVLIVSQFTLAADTQRGLRPSFSAAASPEQARALYEWFCAQSAQRIATQTGVFGADMLVSLQNDGPVTFWLNT